MVQDTLFLDAGRTACRLTREARGGYRLDGSKTLHDIIMFIEIIFVIIFVSTNRVLIISVIFIRNMFLLIIMLLLSYCYHYPYHILLSQPPPIIPLSHYP